MFLGLFVYVNLLLVCWFMFIWVYNQNQTIGKRDIRLRVVCEIAVLKLRISS